MASRASKNSKKKKKSSSSVATKPPEECSIKLKTPISLKTIQQEFIKECIAIERDDLALHIMKNEAKFEAIVQCSTLSNTVILLLVELLNSKWLRLNEKSKNVDQANLIFAKLPDAPLITSNDNLPRYINSVFEDIENNIEKKRIVENKNTAGLRQIIFLFRTLLAKFPNEVNSLSQIIISLNDKISSHIYDDVIPDDIPTLITSLFEDFRDVKQKTKELPPLVIPEDPKKYGLPFREISIFPCYSEVVNKTSPTLRGLIKKGEYKDLETYLDIHFKLLREDMIYPLRIAVGHLLEMNQNISNELYMYDNVKIMEITTHNVYGMVYKLRFIPFGIKSISDYDWNKNSRLKFGSLVCITSKSDNIYPNFKDCFWAIVTNSDDVKKKLEVNVKFENSFVHDFNFNIDYFMFESREVYFEAYFHTLSVLKEIKQRRLPFESLILGKDPKCLFPYYMHRDSIMNVSSILIPNCPIIDPILNWSTESKVLNPSQMEAARLALTAELALIQGPPGTGKTFVGSRVIRILIDTKHDHRMLDDYDLHRALHGQPIIIVTFTNHALDQFLFEVLQFEPDIIRLGSRSEMEEIKSLTLYETKTKAWKDNDLIPMHIKTMKRKIGAIKREMKGLTTVIEDYSGQLKVQNELTDADFKEYATYSQYESLHEMEIGGFTVYTPNDKSLIEFWLTQKDSPAGLDELQHISTDYNPFMILAERDLTIPSDENIVDKYKMVERRVDYLGFDVSDETHLPENGSFADIIEFNPLLVTSEDIPTKTCYEAEQEEPDIALTDTLIETEVEISEKQLKEQKVLNIALEKLRFYINREQFDNSSSLPNYILDRDDIWTLNHEDRRKLYQHWVNRKTYAFKRVLEDYAKDFEILTKELKSVSDDIDLHYLKDAAIVGMTTTGAARYSKLLKKLQPRILFIEEAAEVLEAHIITSLSESVDHLILIGDHEQLRPRSAVDKFAKDYNLNVSLFERLINNDVEHVTLRIQHRMRPEISALVKPIYPRLSDAEKVKQYPNIRGMAYNLFFISHTGYEDEKGKLQKDSTSSANTHEATFIVKLYKYLSHQGYKPSEITILTFYNDQKNLIYSLIQREDDIEKAEEVKIFTVDKFQGEENDIIILSVVRGNKDNYIGHCCVGNRVCVALTRAKMGLYVIGNEKCLRAASKKYMKNDLWSQIIDNFKEARGEALPLCCVNHPGNKHYVKTAEDFEAVKDGGCNKKCDQMLDCKHECPKLCHPSTHEGMICKTECKKILPCNHTCKGICSSPCVLLKCLTSMSKQLKCGHTVNIQCGDSSPERFSHFLCTAECNTNLPCGHKCSGSCGICINSNHARCQEKCDKMLVCGHVCKSTCHFPDACFPCQDYSPNYCSHLKITQCYESYIPCEEACDWKCEHHQCTKKCREICDRNRCEISCKIIQKCNHPCLGLCGELCPDLCRTCTPPDNFKIFFGNEEEPEARFIMLQDCKHTFELSGLDEWVIKSAKSEQIEILKCPKKECGCPIINTPRYRTQFIKSLGLIETVKANLILKNRHSLLNRCNSLMSIYGNNPTDYAQLISNTLKDISNIINKCQTNTLLIITDMIQMFSEILNHSPLVWSKYSQHNTFVNHSLLNKITQNESEVTSMSVEDLKLEFNKCQIINNFFTINENNLTFQDQEHLNKLKKHLNLVELSLIENKHKNEFFKECETFFENFSNLLPTPVTQLQLDTQPIKLTVGWNKCPLGHVFEVYKTAYNECISVCPDCDA